MTKAHLAALLATTSILLTGCSSDLPEGFGGTFQPLPEGAVGIEGAVQHLIEAPPFPGPVTSGGVMVELRSPDLNRRHLAFMARLTADGALDGELVRGSFVYVSAGAALTVPTTSSVVQLDGDTVMSVAACAVPCTVTGPALVAPDGWFESIRTGAGWLLVDPAPTS